MKQGSHNGKETEKMLVKERTNLAQENGRLMMENHNLKRNVREHELGIECEESYKRTLRERNIERKERAKLINEQPWSEVHQHERRGNKMTRRMLYQNERWEKAAQRESRIQVRTRENQ